jgi:hypothetical protein
MRRVHHRHERERSRGPGSFGFRINVLKDEPADLHRPFVRSTSSRHSGRDVEDWSADIGLESLLACFYNRDEGD